MAKLLHWGAVLMSHVGHQPTGAGSNNYEMEEPSSLRWTNTGRTGVLANLPANMCYHCQSRQRLLVCLSISLTVIVMTISLVAILNHRETAKERDNHLKERIVKELEGDLMTLEARVTRDLQEKLGPTFTLSKDNNITISQKLDVLTHLSISKSKYCY